MKKVAISSPYFLPWLGYFDKMKKADIQIIFDNVQRTSRGYSNRVLIKTPSGASLLTLPRLHAGFQQVRDVKIAKHITVHDYLHKIIQRSYGRAPHFKNIYPPIYDIFLMEDWAYLMELNMALITYLYNFLDIQTKIVMASDLDISASLQGTDRLVELVKAVGGDAYIYGGGAKGYQENDKFQQNGLHLMNQKFKTPLYSQLFGKFVSGLSIIDILFNIGIDATMKTLEDSLENWTEDLQNEN